MEQSFIMQFLPLKAKAEHAFNNQDMELASNLIAEFGNRLTEPYDNGDNSYDALRVAYLGASNAALMLGKISTSFELKLSYNKSKVIDTSYSFAKKALEYTKELVKNNNTPDNSLALVTSTSVFLKAASLQLTTFTGWYCIEKDESIMKWFISTADILSKKLVKHFPDNKDIKSVVCSYNESKRDYVRDTSGFIFASLHAEFQAKDEDLKKRHMQNASSLCMHIASSFPLDIQSDPQYSQLILDTLYEIIWYPSKMNPLSKMAPQFLDIIYKPLKDDLSLEKVRESGYLGFAMNLNTEDVNWHDILSDSFATYFDYCNENNITPADIKCVEFCDCVPYLSSEKVKDLQLSTYKALLTLYDAGVFKGMVSVKFEFKELCSFLENCDEPQLQKVLFIFVQIMLEADAVLINNNLISCKIKQCYIDKRLKDADSFKSKACELVDILNSYIDRLNNNNIHHNLRKFTYNDIWDLWSTSIEECSE